MKDSPLITVLLWLGGLSAVVSILLFWRVIANERQLRELNGKVWTINNAAPRLRALIDDALEYSKKNTNIDQLLESIGQKPRTAPAATKPSGK